MARSLALIKGGFMPVRVTGLPRDEEVGETMDTLDTTVGLLRLYVAGTYGGRPSKSEVVVETLDTLDEAVGLLRLYLVGTYGGRLSKSDSVVFRLGGIVVLLGMITGW